MSRLIPTSLRPLLKKFSRLSSAGFAVAIILISTNLALAQTTGPTDGSTPLGLSPGAPAGSHALSGFESINPYNGNLNFHLPLIGVGGRGGAGMSSILGIDSKGWSVRHQETTDPQGNPVDIYTPVANPWVPKAGYECQRNATGARETLASSVRFAARPRHWGLGSSDEVI